MGDSSIHPFKLLIPQSDLDDLQTRLRLTRWPDKEPVNDWTQGAPLKLVQNLCSYWQTQYDWRRCERWINSWPQFTTSIDGIDIYFLHVRSKHDNALPMLLTHGWPGSILEFKHVIQPLIDPEASGGTADDAFHLIIPALPGYAFSSRPKETGWDFHRTARAWAELMLRLGYADGEWVAQGGDWGADVTASLGTQAPKGLKSVHMNSIFPIMDEELKSPTQDKEGEARAKQYDEIWQKHEMAYFQEQGTKPQTLGYGLADSPAGQAAWIYEKFHGWSQNTGDVEEVFSKDEMLDHIMLYWLCNAGTSSARYYWECERDCTLWPIKMPVAVSWFPGDMTFGPKEWCERYYENIVHWREMEKGGHFAAWEVPELFVSEMREWRQKIR